MILICGGLTDITTELVCARLEDLGYPYRLFDQGLYPTGYTVVWSWCGGEPTGTIEGPDWRLDLAEISGVFVRYVTQKGHAPLPAVPTDLETAALAECQAGLLALVEHLPCPVANRAGGSMSNHSKPYQARLVRDAGLLTPRTLVTSDPAAARAFYQECGGAVIFKSVSGVRSIVRRVESRDLDRLETLRHGVAQFQAYVPGENVRVHTVGGETFVTRIRSDAVDYRYASQRGHALEMASTTLPPPVAEACLALTRAMGLCIAGIDLKETPDGEWYCFEINPSPGFAFYEQWTGQPISAALAGLLRGVDASATERG